jgi:hypothetical protein
MRPEARGLPNAGTKAHEHENSITASLLKEMQ